MGRGRVEPGQEFVRDYPRPPRLKRTRRRKEVVFGGVTLAYTTRAMRVLETSHQPVYHIPPDDVRVEHLTPSEGAASFCEWKGRAWYLDLSAGERTEELAAWCYPDSAPPFQALEGCVAFHPSRMDARWVENEKAETQPGDFNEGWIPPDILDPFKDEPGTRGW